MSRASACANKGNPFKVKVNVFSRTFEYEWFPQIFLNCTDFNWRFGKRSFSVNSFISKVFFFLTRVAILARDSSQQYRFMHKSNSTLNTLSSIANQSAALPLAMQFRKCIGWWGFLSKRQHKSAISKHSQSTYHDTLGRIYDHTTQGSLYFSST